MDLFMVVGEQSADLHAAHLLKELFALRPDLRIAAVAGPRMRDHPLIVTVPMEQLQVMGFIDVFNAFPRLIRLFRNIRDEILRLQPKVVVCVDYPGFNLRLARSLRRKGYRGKLIHYICPTVWAWGKGRIPIMAQTLDLLLTIFPFEKRYFAHTPLPVIYVGHPLISKIKQIRKRLPSAVLALFPGSRKGEIEKNLPLQIEVALRLREEIPSMQVVISCANEAIRPLLAAPFPLTEQTYELMQSAHLALATSGTVTLELALFQVPTVVHYAIRPLDRFLAQNIFRIHLPHYCLVNILAQKRVFPELFGPNFTPQTLLIEARRLWTDASARMICMEECATVRHLLGTQDASSEAALHIAQMMYPPFW
jgi:lipid-A-disaccharide synthase